MPATEGKATGRLRRLRAPLEASAGRLPAGDAAALPRYDGRGIPPFVAKIKGVPAAERGERVQLVMAASGSPTWRDRVLEALEGLSTARRPGAGADAQPGLLILDEPTAGLDPKQIIEPRELIKELAGNHTIILSTHILPEVSQTCQRVVIINKGKIVAVDTPTTSGAAARLGNDVRAGGFPRRGRGAALGHVPGVTRVAESDRATASSATKWRARRPRRRRELARAVVDSGWGLLELDRCR